MTAPQIPLNASVYEAVRTHPQAASRFSKVGLTRDYYDYRLGDAARAVGLPVEELSAILAQPAAPADRELAGVV
jgi:hypothetical protein